jgi:hypothetical protein
MNIAKALNNLRPASDWSIRGEVITWLDKEQTEPTPAEIDAEVSRIEAEWTVQEYARDRAKSYPPVGDQLDMLMKDMKNGTTTHQEACEAVKDKYPKPE